MQNGIGSVTWPGWETVRLIGRGSFGAVYEIQRRIFDETEKAALKVITIPQNEGDIDEMRSDGYDDESITATFRSHLKSIVGEYSTMRKMNGSANIVNCDDVRFEPHADQIGWDVYIKMELLTPLVKSLPDPISEEIVVRLGKDLCAALELCRKYDVVHRDIKPQNIFLSDNGDYKLGDFGIAKTVEKTMGGTKIGTYKYMAPEVYNNQPYGAAADIYSLGLVLYWMLNERRLPFMPMGRPTVGADEEARHRRFSGEPIPAPRHGSAELKRIVLKACAFDPKDRFASAREMLDALAGMKPVAADQPEQSLDEKLLAWSRTVPAEAEEDRTVGLFTAPCPAEEKAAPAAEPKKEPQEKMPLPEPPAAEEQRKEEKPAPEKVPVVIAPKPAEKEPESRRIEVPKQVSKPVAQPAAEPVSKKNRLWIIGVCAGLLVFFGLVFYESYHIWLDANCQTPATCKICGLTQGELGWHDWEPDESRVMTCVRCGLKADTFFPSNAKRPAGWTASEQEGPVSYVGGGPMPWFQDGKLQHWRYTQSNTYLYYANERVYYYDSQAYMTTEADRAALIAVAEQHVTFDRAALGPMNQHVVLYADGWVAALACLAFDTEGQAYAIVHMGGWDSDPTDTFAVPMDLKLS